VLSSDLSRGAFLSYPIMLHQMVSVKLNSSNYMLWVSLIMPFIRYQILLGHINSSTPEPAKLVEKIVEKPGSQDDKKVTLVPNPSYEDWIASRQQLISWNKVNFN